MGCYSLLDGTRGKRSGDYIYGRPRLAYNGVLFGGTCIWRIIGEIEGEKISSWLGDRISLE